MTGARWEPWGTESCRRSGFLLWLPGTWKMGRPRRSACTPFPWGMERVRSQKGVPVMTGDEKVLEYLAELSAPYGTAMEIRDGVGYIRLK